MCERLPERISVDRLAEKDTRVQGVIPLNRLERICQASLSTEGDAHVDLTFTLSADGDATITGTLKGCIRLTCQRCLKPMPWTIETHPSLAWVRHETDAIALAREYEPLLWPDGQGSLTALVEDELLLALPIVARHSDKNDCGAAVDAMQQKAPDTLREDNPFAVLKQLKDTRRNS